MQYFLHIFYRKINQDSSQRVQRFLCLFYFWLLSSWFVFHWNNSYIFDLHFLGRQNLAVHALCDIIDWAPLRTKLYPLFTPQNSNIYILCENKFWDKLILVCFNKNQLKAASDLINDFLSLRKKAYDLPLRKTYKICLYLLAVSPLKNNFFCMRLHCDGHANFRGCQQLTFATSSFWLLQGPCSHPNVFNGQG